VERLYEVEVCSEISEIPNSSDLRRGV